MSRPPDPEDSRAILHPGVMAQRVHFERFPVGPAFEGVLDWCWSVEWDLPTGERQAQETLSLPAVNISVGTTPPPGLDPPPGPYAVSPRVVGVATRRTTRVLSGQGWNVAAKASVGGFGALYAGRVADLCDLELPMGDVLPVDAATLGERMAAASDGRARAGILVDALAPVLDRANPERRKLAREVAGIAAVAEQRPEMVRVGDLAAHAGMSVRTLQRLFLQFAGISPSWMVRRLRLIEAAERVARGQEVRWTEVAADLGYSDQAHLSRDFVAAVGSTPTSYAAAQRAATLPR